MKNGFWLKILLLLTHWSKNWYNTGSEKMATNQNLFNRAKKAVQIMRNKAGTPKFYCMKIKHQTKKHVSNCNYFSVYIHVIKRQIIITYLKLIYLIKYFIFTFYFSGKPTLKSPLKSFFEETFYEQLKFETQIWQCSKSFSAHGKKCSKSDLEKYVWPIGKTQFQKIWSAKRIFASWKEGSKTHQHS